MKHALILAAFLAGCAQQAETPDAEPAAVLQPAPAPKPRAATPRASVLGDSPSAVTRDTEALRDQATQYVVRRDSKPTVIDRLTTLTVQARRAATRARVTRRQADVTAARVAADTLAAYLQTQTRAP